jgi:hypothetical protein
MADKPWKKFERYVGRMFGTVRRPGSGAHGVTQGGTDDIKHPLIYAECKSLKKLYSHTLFRDARRKAMKEEKPFPIIVLHEKGTPFDESLVCCRIKDLLPLAIIRGIAEDNEARKQMEQSDAPPMRQWKPTFSERFVSELMEISKVMNVDKDVLKGGVKRYSQFKGAEEAQAMFDDMSSKDVERISKHIDGAWCKPTAQEIDRKKKQDGEKDV